MTFEQFLKSLHLKGFGVSETQTEKLVKTFVTHLDSVRKSGGRIFIPGLGVFKTKKSEAKPGAMIAGRPCNVPARQRFIFTPARIATRPA